MEKLSRGDKGGIDAWRYVKHVGRPIPWPACHELLSKNSEFLLMEDNAAPHKADYTTRERMKEGILNKVD
jgi:hypothetical protein